MDFSGSKENAKMLVERFIETGEQPDFMEFLCFKNCFVEAQFHGYGAQYVVSHFQLYAGISQNTAKIEDAQCKVNKVNDCYCPCEGKDVIQEAKRYNLDFTMVNGKLEFTKVQQREKLEVEYDHYGYYSKQKSKLAC
jgi:hypothetical protein